MDTIENLRMLKNFVDNSNVNNNDRNNMILNEISISLMDIIDKMEKNHNIDNELRQMISK